MLHNSKIALGPEHRGFLSAVVDESVFDRRRQASHVFRFCNSIFEPFVCLSCFICIIVHSDCRHCEHDEAVVSHRSSSRTPHLSNAAQRENATFVSGERDGQLSRLHSYCTLARSDQASCAPKDQRRAPMMHLTRHLTRGIDIDAYLGALFKPRQAC